MRPRPVPACTWLIAIVASAAGACRLEPIPDPPPPVPTSDAGPVAQPDAPLRPADGPPPDLAPLPSEAEAGAIVEGPDVTDAAPDRGPAADAAASDGPPVADALPPDQRPADTTPDQALPPVLGLVAHWRFDEGRGTSSADATGNGGTCTLHNGTAWEASRVARGPGDFAVRLDGENDYLSATVTRMIPRIEAAKSIAYWFVPDAGAPAPSGNQRTCVALADPGMRVGIQVGLDRNRPAAWSWGQNAGFVITSATPPAGARHLTYTFDGTTHRLYLDGALASTSTAGSQSGAVTTIYVGTYDPPSELCAGQIDDLRIYDRALSAAEVGTLAARP